MATTSPGRAPLFRRELKVVTPAHINGPASTAERSLGSCQNGSVSTASAALSIASEAEFPTTGTTETTAPLTRIGTVATLVKKHPDSPNNSSRSMSHLLSDILRTSFARAPPLTTAPWSSQQRPWGCAGRRSLTQRLPAPRSFLLSQQATQSLCHFLQGGPASRNRLGDNKIGEAGDGDEPHGARATLPARWQPARMWAPLEAGRHGRGGCCHELGRVSLSLRGQNCGG